MFSTDPRESAAEAVLRYVNGPGLCIRRVRCGRSFRYLQPDGRPFRDPQHLKRIRSLAIPPAWTNVWICPSANGHLQAIGWDAKGRKQYRYHPRYRAIRDEAKFSRMIAFGSVLALIRRQVEQDLALRGLPRGKVLAAVVRLLETTFIRVGNEEYAQENDSFGLTTMKNRHVRIAGATLLFRFRGKSGLEHKIELTNTRLARIVRQCQELPGYELFEYLSEEGEVCAIDSADVNQYIREVTGQDFTAKDFRTWAGTVLASLALRDFESFTSETQAKKNVVAAIKSVAERLGNTPAVCRKCYVHPAVLECYMGGALSRAAQRAMNAEDEVEAIRAEEQALIELLRKYETKAERKKAA